MLALARAEAALLVRSLLVEPFEHRVEGVGELTQLVARALQGAGQMTSMATSDLAESLADDWNEQDQKSV